MIKIIQFYKITKLRKSNIIIRNNVTITKQQSYKKLSKNDKTTELQEIK